MFGERSSTVSTTPLTLYTILPETFFAPYERNESLVSSS